MTQADLNNDLAFVRQVAEAGRNRPYIGGVDLIVFGGLTALAFAGHWAIGARALSPNLFPLLWIGYGILMTVSGFFLRRRAQSLPGAGAFSNQIDGYVWLSVTFAIGAIVVGTLTQAIFTKDTAVVNWILPASFALYGVAFLTTGKVSSERILVTAAVVQFAAACGCAAFVSHPAIYLFAAISVVVGMVVPGIILSARAKSDLL